MYALQSNPHPRAAEPALRARLPAERLTLAPRVTFRFLIRNGKLALVGDPASDLIPLESFEIETCRRAVARNEPILRPCPDHLGRTVILAYAPGDLRDLACEAHLVSMLHLGDRLHATARQFGMSNLAARVCRALVENGSLRSASRSLGISHQTASSEIRDAMRAAGVHNQSALVHRLAETWLDASLQSEKTIDLIRTTFGLTLRDAKVASLRASGLSRQDAARRLGVSQWSMAESSSNVFATLGVAKAPDLTRIIVDLMLAADLAEVIAVAVQDGGSAI